eukprot:3998952-Lingulodinium_polyedra.AAC.1
MAARPACIPRREVSSARSVAFGAGQAGCVLEATNRKFGVRCSVCWVCPGLPGQPLFEGRGGCRGLGFCTARGRGHFQIATMPK